MTKEEILQYIKNELANEDVEIYLDVDDYKIIVEALEQEPILEKDGTLVVTTENYKNVGRVLVQYGINGSLFYQDEEPCEDAVSRAEVKKIAKEMYLEVANTELDVATISDCISYTSSKCREALERKLQTLPPVTPTRKKGKWIPCKAKYDNSVPVYECSICHKNNGFSTDNFCPNCGAEMESEE